MRRQIYLPYYSFLIIAALPSVATAEIYNCEGRWTNRPCSGAVQATIAEKPASASDGTPGKSEKESALHELTMKSIEAKREFGFSTDLEGVRSFCLSPESSLADCRTQIAEISDRLDAKIQQQNLVRAEEKKVQLQEDANRLAEQRNDIEANKPVAIIDQRRILVVPRDFAPGYHGPNYPQNYQQGSASAGIVVNGVSSTGTVQVSAGGSVVSGPYVPGPYLEPAPRPYTNTAGPSPEFHGKKSPLKGYQDPSRPR